MITREQVMEYFRNENYIEDINDEDKAEISLICCSNSDYVTTILERALEIWNTTYAIDGSNVPDCLVKEIV